MYKIYLAALFFLCSVVSAYACSCKSLDYFESYNSSDFIFFGKTTETNIETANFQVTKVWKGDVKETIQINQPRGKDCTLYFANKNEEYLIFAQKEDDGKYRAYRCAGSQKIDKATKIIEWLNTGKESVGIR